MATNIGELVWKITGDTKNIDKSLKSTDSKMSKFGKTVAAAFSVAALILFAKKAFDVGKALIGAASDAEETANKFNVVFDGITRAGEAADNLAESYGLSHEASQNLLASTSDLLQGFGVAKDESLDLSEQVQMLAADLSSFTNNEGGAEAASKALTSAMLGEREAVKSLGIAITDAELKLFAEETGQVYNEMNKAEKAVLTLNLAIRQSGNAIGDFERSQDSFANQMKIARANVSDLSAILGQELLPTATLAVNKFNELIGNIIATRKYINELKIATEAYEEGTATASQNVVVLTRELKEQQAILAAGSALGHASRKATQERIDALLEEIAYEHRIAGQRVSDEAKVADAEGDRLAAEEERRKAKEESDRLAAEAAEEYQKIVDARVVAFEDQLRLEEEAALIESEILQIRNEGRIAEREARALEIQQEEERHAARIANIQSELAMYSQYAGNVGTIFNNLIQIQMAGDEELTDKKKRNIIALYRIQQAANIAQIAVDTATAIVKAWVSPGFPLAIPLTALIAGIGVTQAAVVASTPPPVALAEGGIVPARPGGTATIIGEGGQDEAVIPLDDGGMGSIRIIVNLDGQPILDTVQSGLNRREIVVEAGSVV